MKPSAFKVAAALLGALFFAACFRSASADISVRLNPGGRDANMTFVAGGSRILTQSGDQPPILWVSATGSSLGTFSVPGTTISSTTISPDGERIATTTTNGNIELWDAKTKTVSTTLTQQNARNITPYISATFSHNGKLIAAQCSERYSGPVMIFTIADNTMVPLPKEVRGVHLLAFSDDDKFVHVRQFHQPSLWYDVATGQPAPPPAGEDELPIAMPDRSHRDVSPITSADGSIAITQEQERADVEFRGRTMPGLRVVSTTLVFTNTKTNSVARSDKFANLIGDVTLSPDAKTAVGVTTFNTVTVWDTTSGHVIRTIPIGSITTHILTTADFGYVTVLRDDGTLTAYKIATGAVCWSVPGAQGIRVSGTVVTPDGNTVISAHNNGVLAAWSLNSGALIRESHDPLNSIVALALSPDGRKLAASYSLVKYSARDEGVKTRNVVRIMDSSTFATLKEIPNDDNRFPFESLVFSPDGATLVGTRQGSGSIVMAGSQPVGEPIFLWDATTGEEKPAPSDSFSTVYSAAYSTNGTQFFAIDANRVHVYNLPAFDLIKHPDQWMYSGSSDSHVAVLSSKNHTLVEGTDYGRIRFWKYTGDDIADKGKTVVPHDEQSSAIRAIALSPDESSAATASNDGTVFTWDVAGHMKITGAWLSPTGLTSIAYTPDGKRIVVGCGDGSVKVISSEDCSTIATMQLLPGVVAEHPTVAVAIGDPAPPPAPSPSRWVSFIPEGEYAASPGAGQFLTGTPTPKESAAAVKRALAAVK